MKETESISIILCVIIVILILVKFNTCKEKFTDNIDDLYTKEILSNMNYDISSIRNLAQLAKNAYDKELYLPIDTVSPNTIKINNLTIEKDLIIDKTNEQILFHNINNNSFYYNCFYKGMIIPWNASINDIPQNWGLCDGSTYYYDTDKEIYLNWNNLSPGDKVMKKLLSPPEFPLVTTPDLRKRFILHENILHENKGYIPNTMDITNDPLDFNNVETKPLGKHNINSTGGQMSVMLNQNEMAPHFHTINFFSNDSLIGTNGTSSGKCYQTYKIPALQLQKEKASDPNLLWHSQFHNIQLGPLGLSSNNDLTTWRTRRNAFGKKEASNDARKADYLITRNNLNRLEYDSVKNTKLVKGNAQTAHENMPPWYALYYIMKL